MSDLRSCAKLPVELTDYIIDYLDFDTLPVAARVAKSWTPRATARLFERLVVWAGPDRKKDERAPLLPESHAPLHYAALVRLCDRNASVLKHVRELQLVFHGSRNVRDEPRGDCEMTCILEAVTRICAAGNNKIRHLGLHWFFLSASLCPALYNLLRACVQLRSVHLVHCGSIMMNSLLATLSTHSKLETLAVLGCFTTPVFDDDSIIAAGAAVPATTPARRNPYQIYLSVRSLHELMIGGLVMRSGREQLNVLCLLAETDSVETVSSHGIPFLQNAMSCVRSVELVMLNGASAQTSTILHIFERVPIVQLIFDYQSDVLKTFSQLFRNTALDGPDKSKTLVLAPLCEGHDSTPRETKEWALVDAALAMSHHTALAKVVLFLDSFAELGAMALPRLEALGLLSVERCEDEGNLWTVPLPWIAQRDRAAQCL